jgi:inhibitor of KinA
LQIVNERSVCIRFGREIDPLVHQRVMAAAQWLNGLPFPGVLSVVPAYATVTLYFDPFAVRDHWPKQASPAGAVCAFLTEQLPDVPPWIESDPKIVEIPVRYGGVHGPDLREVAAKTGLSEPEIIRLHTETLYTVYMIGFLPGFPYLGLLHPALELARRATPRLKVPPGSVAIAGRQTGIYPQSSPGGWHLIGQTEARLFDPGKNPPALLAPGDRVRMVDKKY